MVAVGINCIYSCWTAGAAVYFGLFFHISVHSVKGVKTNILVGKCLTISSDLVQSLCKYICLAA